LAIRFCVMRAIILSIGDELILGQIVDTNAAWLSARLVEQGVMPLSHRAVPDDLDAISTAVKEAAGQAELVIISGGLGPTQDDLTRQAIAKTAGVALVLHKPSLDALISFFKGRAWTMSESNRIQAMIPAGAEVLANPAGTAPGFRIAIGRAIVVVVPGVPREMEVMFLKHIVPMLAEKSGNKILTMKLNCFGLGESVVGEKLGELMRRDRNPLVGTTVSGGICAIRIRGEFDDAAAGVRQMHATADEIKKRLGGSIFGEGDIGLAETVGGMLKAACKTLATAESCTAGLLAAMLTETPGSSAYFCGGWVVYSNKMKTDQLGVPADLICREGAVSKPVACKMAEGALERSGADYALAITGVAGPDGGSPEKPVGTVWIALAEKKEGGVEIYAEKFFFPGARALVRERAAKLALNILRLRMGK